MGKLIDITSMLPKQTVPAQTGLQNTKNFMTAEAQNAAGLPNNVIYNLNVSFETDQGFNIIMNVPIGDVVKVSKTANEAYPKIFATRVSINENIGPFLKDFENTMRGLYKKLGINITHMEGGLIPRDHT